VALLEKQEIDQADVEHAKSLLQEAPEPSRRRWQWLVASELNRKRCVLV
jgi:hypothetical protein